DDAVDAVRSKEAVLNALLEAVRVNRVAKIKVRVAVLVSQRRGGHAELIGGLEPFENFAPIGFFPGGSAMTLVHDDQVEEVAREFLVETWAPLVPGNGLIGGEVECAAQDCNAALDFVPGIAEG